MRTEDSRDSHTPAYFTVCLANLAVLNTKIIEVQVFTEDFAETLAWSWIKDESLG